MISSKALKDIVSEARPIIERQLDDAERIAGFREVVTAQGGDWSSLKALIKAQIQDERDEGKRVEKILAKAEFATGYADMLGWSKMNENNFSADDEFDPITGEFRENEYANAKLAHTIVTGMQTETGRAALTAAVDIMIAREEAEEFQAKASGDNGATGQGDEEPADSMTGDASRSSRGDDSPATITPSDDDAIAAVKGKARLANVADVEPSSSGPIAPASQGEAEAPSVERVTPETDGSAAANTGGDNVDDHPLIAATAGVIVGKSPATFNLRPECLRPENCAGHGSTLCHACKKEAQGRVAA